MALSALTVFDNPVQIALFCRGEFLVKPEFFLGEQTGLNALGELNLELCV